MPKETIIPKNWQIKLSNPVEYKGTKYEELTLDLNALTGKQIKAVYRKVAPLLGNSLPMFSMDYQAEVAAIAAGVPTEVMDNLCAQDFIRVTMEVQAFLLLTGSAKETPAKD